ncbi:hypothetical protein CC80DRAFT_115359 [Byssothecium circinans]|uniref:Rhodopsin domain-containing protein n=1 Tax=Byssothecium circinans TaxID=147558 RepID=A0A6A5TS08_9PLEO|nr:hypothetical protein CC80DRAFT_115359 [Byssothecium circinans]
MMALSEVKLARIGEQLESIAIAFLTLSWLFIGLRIYTRTCIRFSFGWDDFAMIVAGMVFTVFCSCVLYIEARGGGTHVTSIAQLDDLTKWVIASEASYIITIFVLKISLAIFFMRIVVEQWHRALVYTTVAICAISSISAFFYAIFRCGPDVAHYASLQLQNACMSRTVDRFFAYQQAAFAFLTDCVFVVLPVIFLWNANMERRSKVLVGLILSLATVGCICSAIRFQYVDGLTDVRDFFWSATNVSIWSTIEPGTGIIAGSMAALRPLLKQAFATARFIRSTILQSHKTSNGSSQQQQSGRESHVDAEWRRARHQYQHRGDTNTDIESQNGDGGLIEMRSDSSKKGGSTEDILPSGRCREV